MKLTKKEAVELSIKKWEFLVENPEGDPLDKYPELEELIAKCGLCEKYFNTTTLKLSVCGRCPIRPKVKDYDGVGCGCLQTKHPWNRWMDYPTSENAQAVLDLIKSIKI